MEIERDKVDMDEVFKKLDKFFVSARWPELFDLKEALKKNELSVLATALRLDELRRIFVHKYSQSGYNICGHDKESSGHSVMPREIIQEED